MTSNWSSEDLHCVKTIFLKIQYNMERALILWTPIFLTEL